MWPLAVVARALTSANNATEVTLQFRYLLAMQCGTGTMHESVDVADPGRCTRTDFEWVRALARPPRPPPRPPRAPASAPP